MQNTSVQLSIFDQETLEELTLSLSDRLAKISLWQENEKDLKGKEVALSSTQLEWLLTSDQVYLSGKMLKELSPQILAQTFGQFSKPLPTLGIIELNGNCLIQSGFYPKIESGYTLSDILQTEVSQEYFLSQKTMQGLMKGKSDLMIGTWRTHKDGQGFREVSDGNCPTIPARAREDGSGQPVIMVNNENDFLQIRDGRDNRSCLRSGRVSELGYKDQSIRRLTEIECERLQGFPDNWTEYGNYNGIIKKIPKTQRYKMLGNAVTVKVVEEIAKRLNLD